VATLRNLEFQNSEYEAHQVGPKDFASQNFSFLVLKAEPVGEVKILLTVRDGRIFLLLKSCYLAIKISNQKNSFFSSRNQYFPHIPYVASKNRFRSNLGTRFLSSNGLRFGDFWSRIDNFKIPKDFLFLKWTLFQESAIIFVFVDFQVNSLLASIRVFLIVS
jgi:hypothetical protein